MDDLNPVLNFTRREVENLLHFVEEESNPAQLSLNPSKMKESVLQLACLKYPHLITKVRQPPSWLAQHAQAGGDLEESGCLKGTWWQEGHVCVLVGLGKKSFREGCKSPALPHNIFCTFRTMSVLDRFGGRL